MADLLSEAERVAASACCRHTRARSNTRCWSQHPPHCRRRDNYRPFFEQTFPLLLRRVFGYDGASWLTTLAQGGKEADISALLDLLSPIGALLHVSESNA